MKNCCVCSSELVFPDKGYPRFMTDPDEPELVCLVCLPGEILRTAKLLPPEVKKELFQRLSKSVTLH